MNHINNKLKIWTGYTKELFRDSLRQHYTDTRPMIMKEKITYALKVQKWYSASSEDIPKRINKT